MKQGVKISGRNIKAYEVEQVIGDDGVMRQNVKISYYGYNSPKVPNRPVAPRNPNGIRYDLKEDA